MQWIKHLYDLCAHFGYKWTNPLIHNHDGLVIFEWMSSNRRLNIYSSKKDDSCWYLKSWGPDTNKQMEEGLFETEKMLGLYLWVNQIQEKGKQNESKT